MQQRPALSLSLISIPQFTLLSPSSHLHHVRRTPRSLCRAATTSWGARASTLLRALTLGLFRCLAACRHSVCLLVLPTEQTLCTTAAPCILADLLLCYTIVCLCSCCCVSSLVYGCALRTRRAPDSAECSLDRGTGFHSLVVRINHRWSLHSATEPRDTKQVDIKCGTRSADQQSWWCANHQQTKLRDRRDCVQKLPVDDGWSSQLISSSR
jgi:hypothetical protein